MRAGAGEWRCMFSGIEFDCMDERVLLTPCLSDGCHFNVVREKVREEQNVWQQRSSVLLNRTSMTHA